MLMDQILMWESKISIKNLHGYTMQWWANSNLENRSSISLFSTPLIFEFGFKVAYHRCHRYFFEFNILGLKLIGVQLFLAVWRILNKSTYDIAIDI